MSLPSDLTASPLDLAELDEFTAFVQGVALDESGRKHFTRDELEEDFRAPGFDVGRDTLVLRDASGVIVGAEWVGNRAPYVRWFATGFVATHRLGEGIGTALLDWARGVATSRVDEAPAGARVVMSAGVDSAHQPSMDLAVGYGMELTRYFLEMRIDFDADISAARFPEGLTVRSVVPGDDDAMLYAAIDEAFGDHFGHVDTPFEAGLERFRHWMSSGSRDPTLWWLVLDGDDVVGANLCDPAADGDEDVGYVVNLSVRKPWRGRGIARALLLHSFAEFVRRGKLAATLHVDAASLTGATRLYESVGMRETERYAAFELELRPGEDLIVR
jgi:mycothiol synthase